LNIPAFPILLRATTHIAEVPLIDYLLQHPSIFDLPLTRTVAVYRWIIQRLRLVL
jgi:hypothetical protein